MTIEVANIHTDLYQNQKLKEIADVINSGGVGVDSSKMLPNGYSYELDATTGSLKLKKGNEVIARQNSDGSWFKTSVSTGVGSLHLGGGESSDPAHSLSSIGQNIGFKNEAFNATPEAAVVWFPPWQGLSGDIGTEYPATYLKFEALQTAYAPNGIALTDGVAYDFITTMSLNLCIAAVTTKTNENYSGKITNIIRSYPKGIDLHVSSRTVNLTAGQVFTIEYPSLYFARNGDQLRLIMQKEDGQPLQVVRGSMNSHPWRTLRARVFSDVRLDEKVTKSADGLMRKEDKAKIDEVLPVVLKGNFYTAYDFLPTITLNGSTVVTEKYNALFITTQNLNAFSTNPTDGEHVGIQGFATSSTNNGYITMHFPSSTFPDSSGFTTRVWFKTPSTFDNTAYVNTLGTFTTASSMTHRAGLIIEGNKAFGGEVIASVSSEKGTEYTLSADTWYIGKFELLSDGKFKASLFSDSGSLLFSYTSTNVMTKQSVYGLKMHSKTTTANIHMGSVDLIDFAANISANRVMV